MPEITDPDALKQLNAGGDDFLKTLDPSIASQVKALAEGRMALPSSFVLRSPYGQQLMAGVSQYDPTFDAANQPARVAARKAFTSGAQSRNITSFNTAIGHLGTLAQSAEELGNRGFTPWNSVANAAETATGDPRVTNFNVAKQAVVDELERAFKGTGGNVHEIEQWENTLNSSRSPAQLRGAIRQAADLLNSRINAMRDSYNSAMGTTEQPLPMLNDHAAQALGHFQSPDYLAKGYGAIGGSAPASNQDGPPSPPAAPGAPPPTDPTGGGAPSSPGAAAVNTTARDEVTPEQRDIAKRLEVALNSGQIHSLKDAQAINPYVDPGDIQRALEYRAKGGKGYIDVTTPVATPVQKADAAGAAAAGLADTVSLGTLNKVGSVVDAGLAKLHGDNRSFGDVYDSALAANNATLDQAERDHPIASLAGQTAGFLTGDAIVGRGIQALGRAVPGAAALGGRIPQAFRPLAQDAAYGAAYGAGSSDSLNDAPGAALTGAGLATAGGVLGRGAARGAAAVVSPVANAGVRRLTDAGVTLTPGQILGAGDGLAGRAVKGVEDRLAGFPIIGDVINNARRGGVEDFNRAAINDALAPIGGQASDIGHAGVADAQQQVSAAYDRAISRMTAVPDPQFATDIRSVQQNMRGLSQDHRDTFMDIMDRDIQPYVQGGSHMTGAELQAAKQGLDREIAHYSGANASPQDRRLADRLSDVRDAFMSMAGRTSPDATADYRAADQAFSMLSRVNGAAEKAKDGVFSPNQFRQSVVKKGYGTTTATNARGGSRMQQLATDASTILPSTTPDSGTAGRAALGMLAGKLAGGGSGAALGGAAGYQQDGVIGALTGATLGAAAFSRPGLRAIQYGLAGSRNGPASRAIGSAVLGIGGAGVGYGVGGVPGAVAGGFAGAAAGRRPQTLGDILRRNAALGGAVGAPLLLESRSK